MTETKKPAGKSNATKLVSLVMACSGELFHTPLREPFITIDGVTMSLTSPEFEYWLAREFVRATKKMPSANSLREARTALIGSALFTGVEREVYNRVAAIGDRVYVDLGHEIAVITPDGWSVEARVPDVRFFRTRGFLPLPQPVRSGQTLTSLIAEVINTDGDNLKLVVAWLVAACRGRKPFPILNLIGEQGAGKSTAARKLRRSLDPNVADSRVVPREMRDLMIAARNGYVIYFDNLTRLDEWLINGLCCLATGAGSATRELTTDTNEIIINAARPIVLTGINDVLSRPDLLDRALVVTLDPIPDDRRLTEAESDAAFEARLPIILGALFDAVACALKQEPTTRPERLPRMADFATTIVAASPALGWAPDEFLTAYAANREGASESLLDGNVVAVAIKNFMADQTEWKGSTEQLRVALNDVAPADHEHNKSWPRTAKHLNNRLREIAPGLRSAGIDIAFGREKAGRFVELRNPKVAAPMTQPEIDY